MCAQKLNPLKALTRGLEEKRKQILFLSASWTFYDLVSVRFTQRSDISLSVREPKTLQIM